MNRGYIWNLLGLVLMTLLAIGCTQPVATEDTTASSEPSEQSAQAASDSDEPVEVNYLFVHSARGSSLADGVLRLVDLNPATLFFSDRPERITGHLTTEEFVANWGTGDDSFGADPPNATVSILSGDEPQEIVVVLKSPRIEEKDLLYDVEVLDGASEANGLATSVFIDVIGRPLTPLSVAGTTRRVARRTVRRN